MRALLALFRWLFTVTDPAPPEPICAGWELSDADREAIRRRQQSQLQIAGPDTSERAKIVTCRRGCPCDTVE